MRAVTALDQAGYPGPMEWLYAWLRRHPWLVDGTLAVLLLFMASLPIKMVLRWTMNLKYLVAIPEYFFNI